MSDPLNVVVMAGDTGAAVASRLQTGSHDPQAINTPGFPGMLFLRVPVNGVPAAQAGLYMKVLTEGADTNWELLSGGGLSIDIQDEGVLVVANPTFINFTGAGVAATPNGLGVDVTIPGGSGFTMDVQDEGVAVQTDPTFMNFIGAGVTAAANGAGVDITIPGATGFTMNVQDEGVAVQTDPTFMNFIGAGVTAAANGAGVDITIPGAASDPSDYKNMVNAVSVANINLAAPGNIIDGVDLSLLPATPSFLAKDQTVPAENGIYDWNGPAVPATRRSDANTSALVTQGTFTFALDGTINADTSWVLVTPDPIVLGVTALNFQEIAGLAGTSIIFDQVRVVAKNGNDGTANNTWEKPFLTIAAALASITDAAPAKRYTVLVMPGTYTEAVALPANISLVGSGDPYSTRIDGAFTIAADWGNALENRAKVKNITLVQSVAINFQPIGASNSRLMFDTCVVQSTFTTDVPASTIGAANSGVPLLNCIFDNPGATTNWVDIQGGEQDWFGCSFASRITFNGTAGTADGTQVNISGCKFNRDLFFIAAGLGRPLKVSMGGNTLMPSITYTLNQPSTVLTASPDSIPLRTQISIASGATIVRRNDADGVGYSPLTPADWAVVPDTVQEALDELASLPSIPERETFTLTAPDIANGYLDLANIAEHNTVIVNLEGASLLLEGATEDYTLTDALVTRVTFDPAVVALLVVGQKVQIQYWH